MIIVDELKRRPWRFKMACHLASTRPGQAGILELLRFATCCLGLKPKYAQRSRSGVVHIDLTANKRRLAIKHGARAVTCKDFIRKVA